MKKRTEWFWIWTRGVKRWFPLFHVWIELPFFSLRSVVAYYRWESQTIEYLAFCVSVWKWHFEIGFYDTDKRIKARREIRRVQGRGDA